MLFVSPCNKLISQKVYDKRNLIFINHFISVNYIPSRHITLTMQAIIKKNKYSTFFNEISL